jgi:hypothetical protein
MKLVLPMPPNIGNGSHGHWSRRHRQKNAYWTDLDTMQGHLCLTSRGEFVVPPPPARPYHIATITATFYVGARMDTDNVFRRAKWPIDWFKTRGYIEDDRDDRLIWTALPKQVVKRGQPYRIEVTLEAHAPPT